MHPSKRAVLRASGGFDNDDTNSGGQQKPVCRCYPDASNEISLSGLAVVRQVHYRQVQAVLVQNF